MGEKVQAPNKWHGAAPKENGGNEHYGKRAGRQKRRRRRIGRKAVRNCTAETAEPHDGLLLQGQVQMRVAVEQPGDGKHVQGAADQNGDDGGKGETNVPSMMANERAHTEICKHDGFSNLA